MRNIYEKAIETMLPEDIDYHESDLYLKVNKQSNELIKNYDFRNNVTMFISAIPPYVYWYDIPFAYLPYWERKNDKSNIF